MTLNEFQVLALRTYNDLGDKLQNSLHMTTGMSSELLKELQMARIDADAVNTMEEFGDILWFAVVYAHIHGITIPEKLDLIEQAPSIFSESNVGIYIGTLLDMDKGALAYGKQYDEEVRRVALLGVLYHMNLWSFVLSVNPEVAMERVIAKLKKRFPDKFSNEQAVTRNLEVERAALEGGEEAA